ncbi:MAG: hypoxanthine phosphoribosyltransferase [Deltaproteobacteria bacterium]|nr:hypoxanthine phosphoribosyltransferase [Deltaproteobacteria bacterium]
MEQPKIPKGMDLVLSPEQISMIVKDMARNIDKDYEAVLLPQEKIVVMGVLNGAFIFMADLVRELKVPFEVDFIRLSSYQDADTSSGQVVMLKAPEKPLKGRHILVVEDLADCGLTLNWLMGFLQSREPASVKIAVVVDKTERKKVNIHLDYMGFQLKEGFLVGYGIDYAQDYRNLKGIYKLIF